MSEGVAEQLRVPASVLTTTGEFLRGKGRLGYEGVVLWQGVTQRGVAVVEEAVIPHQIAHQTTRGLAVEIPWEEQARLVSALPAGRCLLCKVHSHGEHAYLSRADRDNPYMAFPGAFSVVIPWFGTRFEADLAACAVFYYVDRRGWRELCGRELTQRVVVINA